MALNSKLARIRVVIGLTLLGMLAGKGVLALESAAAHGRAGKVQARVARALTATDSAHLHYVSASGSLLYEQGRASGTLPGSMRVHLDVGATFTGSFTIYARGGTITGRGTATPHGSGVYESFAGSLVVNGGSGRYAQAHGRAGLYGTFNRNTYGLLVQTTGTLHY
ncbi:MAG: hypothetical protein WA484_08925 [Solirubrobacteraceae bacterium]